jgi:hypothetical protein
MISNENYPKKPIEFYCEKCDFLSCNKKDYSRHIKTKKHLSNDFQGFSIQKTQKNPRAYECICGKTYKDYSGLWRHKKKCPEKIPISSTEKEKLLLKIIENNNEMITKMMDIVKNGTHNTNCNNTTNKTFNLNLYLNETCKNAMNITDFVSSINLNLEDLEHTGRQGYIEGITNIIIKNLILLEQWFRPIHCSDLKREVLYIKENDKWEKETIDKPILTKAIKTIANKNIKQIDDWREKYPDCTNSSSRKNDMYLKIVRNSMSGGTKEECDKNITKIISNVAKQTIIDKIIDK